MLKARELFQAGVRIIGLFMIVWGIYHFINMAPSLFSYLNNPDMPHNVLFSYRFSLFIHFLSPVLLVVVGVYFLKGGGWIVKQIGEAGNSVSGEIVFYVLMKTIGLLLIVYALPKVAGILSDIAYIRTVNESMGADAEQRHVWTNLLSTAVLLGLGFYILKSGKLFYTLAFPKED